MAVAGSLTYDTKLETKGFESGLSKVGSATKTAFVGAGVAVGALVTAIAGVTVASTKAYADYEQLVGGVETLFGKSSKQLQKYADVAYKTAGLSANQYMSTVTSFSASLLQSLGGNTKKATEYANRAVIDMADNANKMGTSMETIQFAYQGFAKQNYTMLDNLKLGYGGTKTEMERLIVDASKMKDVQKELGITVDANSMSFGNIVNAISVMQKKMGIAGTTSKEASSTITGSVNAMKGAWENLLVTFATGEGVEEAMQNLFDSISTVASNVVPVVMTILEQVPIFIEELIKMAVEQIPVIINELLPSIVNSAIVILNTLLKGIQDNLQIIVTGVMEIVMTLVNGIVTLLPEILKTGITLLITLAKGISESLPELIPVIIDCILLICEILIDNLDLIIDAGILLILALIEGIFNALPDLVMKLPELILKITQALLKLIFVQIPKAGAQIVTSLVEGLFKYYNTMIKKIKSFFKGTIFEPIVNKVADMAKAGLDLIRGLWNGIQDAKSWLLGKIKGFANSVIDSIKDFFGIKSPSRVMRDQVGQWLPKGIAVGIDANTDNALNSIDKMNNEIMNKMNKAVNTEMAKASFSGTSGSVSQILSANSMIQVENYNKLYLDGEQIYDNQQTVQQRKNLQYSFGGGNSK